PKKKATKKSSSKKTSSKKTSTKDRSSKTVTSSTRKTLAVEYEDCLHNFHVKKVRGLAEHYGLDVTGSSNKSHLCLMLAKHLERLSKNKKIDYGKLFVEYGGKR